MDHFHCGRLSDVADIPLVGDPEYVNARAAQALVVVVQGVRNEINHKCRHLIVDLAGQVDEARLEAVHTRFPGEIERVERYAVPADSGAGIERHKTKRLCGRSPYHLPHI